MTRGIDDLSERTFFTIPLISPAQSIRPRFNIFGWISRSGWLPRQPMLSRTNYACTRAIVSLRWYSRPDKFVSETTDCAPPRPRFYKRRFVAARLSHAFRQWQMFPRFSTELCRPLCISWKRYGYVRITWIPIDLNLNRTKPLYSFGRGLIESTDRANVTSSKIVLSNVS